MELQEKLTLRKRRVKMGIFEAWKIVIQAVEKGKGLSQNELLEVNKHMNDLMREVAQEVRKENEKRGKNG